MPGKNMGGLLKYIKQRRGEPPPSGGDETPEEEAAEGMHKCPKCGATWSGKAKNDEPEEEEGE